MRFPEVLFRQVKDPIYDGDSDGLIPASGPPTASLSLMLL